ncbi:MAG: hypothetical protein N2749_00070 [Clostridia bacterium]|nr:hypothetical protein [Clostridia bacterium]
MEHSMKLNEKSFKDMKNGIKIREYRINDEKRRNIKLGDTIKFTNLSDINDSILTKVEGLLYYSNWYSCYEDFFEKDLKQYYSSVEAAVIDTYNNWYSKYEEEQYGVVIIKIKLCKG